MTLPSLNALRAFEAASRTGSFVAAAQELGVSPAAVSMQVRNLERHLKKRLFLRTHNRITMTEAARALYPSVASAFTGLGAAIDRLVAPEQRPRLVVSAPPALGERWLAPIVAEFRHAEPRVGLDLRLEDDPVDLVADRVDIRVAEDAFLYSGFVIEPVLTDAYLPLSAPGHARGTGGEPAADLAQIPDDRFIHVATQPSRATHPGWADWFSAVGVTRQPNPRFGLTVGNHSLALALAARGAGVALGSRALSAPERAAGTLVALSTVAAAPPEPWVAVIFHARRADRLVTAFVEALRRTGAVQADADALA